MNILYICSPSIIDAKWMSYFSQDAANNIYMTTLHYNEKYLTGSFRSTLAENHIELLPSLTDYSFSSPLTLIRGIRRLQRSVKALKIDLVHVMFSSPYALWVNHLNVPCLITNRGSDILIVIPGLSEGAGVKSKIHYALTARAFEKARAITGTSIKTIKAVKEQFGKDAHLIRSGVKVSEVANTTLSEDRLPELRGKKIIFFPRSILPLYNTTMQIEAIKMLPEKIREDHLFVFVRGMIENAAYQNEVREQLKALDGVSFKIYDYLAQEEMWGIYNAASLTISTPKSDGTPNSALEAMAASCPLIMGSIPLDEDLFNDQLVLKLKEDSPSALCEAIQEALSDYPGAKLKAAFENVIQRADWKNEMGKLQQLYQRVLNT